MGEEMLTEPIADLHCDLLMALAAGKAVDDVEIRCAVPQLRRGKVYWQMLAIFVETGPDAVEQGERQAEIYAMLFRKHPKDFHRGWTHLQFDPEAEPKKIQVYYAIENASGFCGEDEPLEQGLRRLDGWIERCGKPGYVSLTWKQENRFGGGNESTTGLKPDGVVLLDFLKEKGIAVDLSHTSDALAEAILKRDQTVIASHSNFRSVCDVPRNLPDSFAQEIIRRGGVIGLNAVRHFVGSSRAVLARHIEHALALGAEKNLCFGADFFWEGGVDGTDYFFDDFGDASHYPSLLVELRREGVTDRTFLADLAYRNAHRFFAGRMGNSMI